MDRYDAGLLNDYGGGDVAWWHDYIRGELDRAHESYASQLAAAEARIEELEEALTAVLEYEPDEICYDEFAYHRLVESYRTAARSALHREEV